MFRCYLFFLSLFFSLDAAAQNWQAVHLGWRYNYKLDSGNSVAASIWADSVKVVSGDSVFYLNRIVSHCDTCHATLGGPNPCDSCYELINQPQFLQRKMTAISNGNFYFSDTSRIALNPKDSLAWLFDSTANITAIVLSTQMDTIFNQTDSVKTILLSSGDTLKISKQYGVLQYPCKYGQNSYFYLVGIEGPNLGEQVPDFWDFYDFNVGDVFCYEHYMSNVNWITPFIGYDQYIITSKNNYFPDSVVYAVNGFVLGDFFPGVFLNNSYSNFLTYRYSKNHLTNLVQNELVYVPGSVPEENSIPEERYDKAFCSYDTNGVFQKYFGPDNFQQWGGLGTNFTPIDSVSEVRNILDYFGNGVLISGSVSVIFKVGFGLTNYFYHNFETGVYTKLAGYLKNGDSTGVLLKNPKYEAENNFSLYPNPVAKSLHLNFKSSREKTIQIKDILGKIVFENNSTDTYTEIDLTNVSDGVYIVSVLTENEICNQKIVVSKK